LFRPANHSLEATWDAARFASKVKRWGCWNSQSWSEPRRLSSKPLGRMQTMDKDFSSPLVTRLANAIWWLRNHTLHGLLKRRITYLGTDSGIEVWASLFLALSIFAFALVPTSGPFGVIFLIVAVLRLLEILINALHVTIFYGVVDRKEIAGYRRIVILLIFNFIEFVFWFAFIYRWMPAQFTDFEFSIPLSLLSYSFSTATGVGNPPVVSDSNCSIAVSLVESSLGLFMIVAVLARFVSYLPRPPENSA